MELLAIESWLVVEVCGDSGGDGGDDWGDDDEVKLLLFGSWSVIGGVRGEEVVCKVEGLPL